MWSLLVSKKTLFLIGYNLYKLIPSMLFGRHLKQCLFNLHGSLRGHEFLRTLSEVIGTHLNARLTSPPIPVVIKGFATHYFHCEYAVSVNQSRERRPASVFPRLAPVERFPALLHRLRYMVTCFPALGIGCKFSCAWHRSRIFPRLARHRLHVFPRFCIGYMFSRA